MFSVLALIMVSTAGCKNGSIGSIKDEVWNTSETYTPPESSTSGSNTSDVSANNSWAQMIQDSLNWYDTIDEAMMDKSLLDDKDKYSDYSELLENKILEITYGNTEEIFFKVPLSKNYNKPVVCALSINKDGDKCSNPYGQGYAIFKPALASDYDYDVLDSAVADLMKEYYLYDLIGQNRGGEHLWYSGWENEDEVKRIRIAGNPVTKIIPVKFDDGITRYFWYYDKTNLSEPFSKFNFSSYTYRELEEALQLTIADE